MSALDLLPEYVVKDIRAKSRRIRDDLLAIPDAEEAGWKVTFRNDHWHNAATFQKGVKTIWSTGRDWRASTFADGRYGVPRPYRTLAEALRHEGDGA
jgi:hypothetical protein